NIKFTGLVYGGIILGLTAIIYYFRYKEIHFRLIGYAALIFLAAVVLVGYQPYVINIAHHGNPFYPVIGKGAQEVTGNTNIEIGQAPEDFIEKDRFTKLFYSLFSHSDYRRNRMPVLKRPFSLLDGEIYSFYSEDVRFGGFGPFFGSILVIMLAGIAAVARKGPRLLKPAVIAYALILLPVLINPEAWWARLAPQLWLLPFPLIIALYYTPKKQYTYTAYIKAFCLSILILNILVVGNRHLEYRQNLDGLFEKQMQSLRTDSQQGKILCLYPGSFEISLRNKLRHYKITYEIVPKRREKRLSKLAG
ncbi:MAG: hypothetical protein GY757_43560, partial [bacterium]|nr:hypothetical protein [bacterium]